jgi:hypothetical protein
MVDSHSYTRLQFEHHVMAFVPRNININIVIITYKPAANIHVRSLVDLHYNRISSSIRTHNFNANVLSIQDAQIKQKLLSVAGAYILRFHISYETLLQTNYVSNIPTIHV